MTQTIPEPSFELSLPSQTLQIEDLPILQTLGQIHGNTLTLGARSQRLPAQEDSRCRPREAPLDQREGSLRVYSQEPRLATPVSDTLGPAEPDRDRAGKIPSPVKIWQPDGLLRLFEHRIALLSPLEN